MCVTQCLITLHVWCEVKGAWALSDTTELQKRTRMWMIMKSFCFFLTPKNLCPFAVILCSLAHVWVRTERQGQVSVCLEFKECRSMYPPFIGLVWDTVYMCGGRHTRALLLLWRSEIFGVAWCGPRGAAARSRLGVLGFQFGLMLLSHMTLRLHSNVAQRYIMACWRVSLSDSHQSCCICVAWLTDVKATALPEPVWSMYSGFKGSLTCQEHFNWRE